MPRIKVNHKFLAVMLFVLGFIVFLADAWVGYVRCMAVGTALMLLAAIVWAFPGRRAGQKTLIKSIAVYGVALWLVMFSAVSVLLAFNLYSGTAAKVTVISLAGFLGYLFSRKIDQRKMIAAIFVGTGLVAAGFLLDGLITYRFDNTVFSSPYLWIGYGFTLAGAIAAPYVSRYFIPND